MLPVEASQWCRSKGHCPPTKQNEPFDSTTQRNRTSCRFLPAERTHGLNHMPSRSPTSRSLSLFKYHTCGTLDTTVRMVCYQSTFAARVLRHGCRSPLASRVLQNSVHGLRLLGTFKSSLPCTLLRIQLAPRFSSHGRFRFWNIFAG